VSGSEINYLRGCREFYSQPVPHYLFSASIFHAGLNQCGLKGRKMPTCYGSINSDDDAAMS